MDVWPVMVESWQLECCGHPPTVGDDIAWTLNLINPGDVAEPEDFLSTLAVEAEPHGQPEHDAYPTLIRHRGLTAYWRAPRSTRGRTRVRGLLLEDHHIDVPDDMPATYGTVRQVRVVTQTHELRQGGDQGWFPVPGTVRTREVTTSPASFFDGDLDGNEPLPIETGILVDLAVHDHI